MTYFRSSHHTHSTNPHADYGPRMYAALGVAGKELPHSYGLQLHATQSFQETSL